jgi:hypothetical protein
MSASGVSSTVIGMYGAMIMIAQAMFGLAIFLYHREDFYGILAGWAVASLLMIGLNNFWIGIAAGVVS